MFCEVHKYLKLSIVIVCWNDLAVIKNCLESIYGQSHKVQFEVLVSDNGSTDGSVQYIRDQYPKVRLLENNANLGFAKSNNVGIHASTGDYVLILNPDTIAHVGALDKWIEFADRHQEAGAFGCRVLNADGTFHRPAQVFPTIWRYWISAFHLEWLGRYFDLFAAGEYPGWDGMTERLIDWQSGCCVLFRAAVLKELGGFDERFFYNFEETDLCKRTWQAGHKILYTPDPMVTHLWGQSTKRFPIRFEIEKLRNRYRYFWKHHGPQSLRPCRRVILAHLYVRQAAYGLSGLFKSNESLDKRLEMYRVVIDWNRRLDPLQFIEKGEEPHVGYEPLAPAPKFI
jgi:GT2 family glycosyltransferase